MNSLVDIPLFRSLSGAKNVLVAGCGGGFDVYCGVPLALALRRLGKKVTLANLTFAVPRSAVGAESITKALTRIDATTKTVMPYFPEWYLACWLRQKNLPHDVYCFDRTGVKHLREAYAALIEREGIDAILLVDGGTDSLMRGDEASLGTPHEDIASLVALEDNPLPRFLACLGFGVDAFHGVCHAQFLENAAALARAGAFLGTFSLLPQQEEAEAYVDLVRFATANEPRKPSIVNNSIASAVEGQYGDHHSISKTRGSTLFISPLMSIYWCFALQAVAERVLYKDQIRETESFSQIHEIIEKFRDTLQVRARTQIPG